MIGNLIFESMNGASTLNTVKDLKVEITNGTLKVLQVDYKRELILHKNSIQHSSGGCCFIKS